MTEEVNPEAMSIASMVELRDAMLGVKKELEALRKSQKTDVHLDYSIDLSKARDNEEIADFVKMGLEISSILILPLPSAISIRLRGLTDPNIDLEKDEELSLYNHEITRIIVTNTAGTGTAKIHVYGRWVR